jgi:hypothetical protein
LEDLHHQVEAYLEALVSKQPREVSSEQVQRLLEEVLEDLHHQVEAYLEALVSKQPKEVFKWE